MDHLFSFCTYLFVGDSTGLAVGSSVGSDVPHKLPGGSALRLHTCSLNQSMPLDILE